MIEKVKEFMVAAGHQISDFPTASTSDERILRLRLLFEEMFELTEASGVEVATKKSLEKGEWDALDLGKLVFSTNPPKFDFIEIADALVDLDYILKGTVATFGLDPEPLFDAVHENNMTKFVDGWRDENGKWRKGPSYKPVDLRPLLDAQVAGEPPWVEYKQEEPPLDIPNGYYKDKKGETHYFSAGPRDKFIWKLVDGRIAKGVEKSKFGKYFNKV